MISVPRFSIRTTLALATCCAIVFAILAALNRGIVRKGSEFRDPPMEVFTGAPTWVIIPESVSFDAESIRRKVMQNLPKDSGFVAADVGVYELGVGDRRVVDFSFNRFYRYHLYWDGMRYSDGGEAYTRNEMMREAIRLAMQQLADEYAEIEEQNARQRGGDTAD